MSDGMKPLQRRSREQDASGGTGAGTTGIGSDDHDHRIPIVNISPFLLADSSTSAEEREAVANQWDRAMRTVGLAVVVFTTTDGQASDVPPSETIIQDLRSAALEFFHLPLEYKTEHCLNEGYGRGGYVPVGIEAVARSSGGGDLSSSDEPPPDPVESLVFFHGADTSKGERVVPSNPPTLQPAVASYWYPMVKMLETLMRLSAVALGLPSGYFDDVLREYRYDLRLAYYPPIEAGAAGDGADDDGGRRRMRMRYGAHTDYTGFTLLRQDPEASGLEVQLRSGEWIPVPPKIGGQGQRNNSFVVNAGDLIQVWTNDRWRSPPHRVVQPPSVTESSDGEGAGAPERLSLVFFTGPADDVVIEALPTCVDDDEGGKNPRRYQPISAGEHLRRKLDVTTVRKRTGDDD